MKTITSFSELTSHLKNLNSRKRIAVANAVDSFTLDAVLLAVDAGIAEAILIGEKAVIESQLLEHKNSAHIRIVDIADALTATLEAVRMVKSGEADILMKGLVNTDVILRAILDKEKGLLKPGNVLAYVACFEIPTYHKLLFMTDPAVIPYPDLAQRKTLIHYCIKMAQKFGVTQPKIALIHATEKPSPKIQFMNDYLEIMQNYRDGEFGDVIMDGPIDFFLALDKERGGVKNIPTPVLGDTDIAIFPNFESANVAYKSLMTFGGAEMGGLLQGTEKPVVMTSRGDSTESKFNSIAVACILA